MQRHQHGGNIYQYGSVIDFSANINPLGMPAAVQEAAMQGVIDACHYPEAENRRLVRAIADTEAKNGINLSDSQIICGNGAAELIFLLCRTIRPKGAILLAPSFAEYAQALQASGSRIEWIHLQEENGFTVTARTLEMMEQRINAGLKTDTPIEMMFICQPNNPTGQLNGEVWMERILAMCRRYHLWLVLDACFLELLEESETAVQHRITDRCLQYNRSLVLKAFTKSFAMAGLRLGYLMGQDEQCMRLMRENLQPWNVSLPAQYAGLAALKEKDFLKESRKFLTEEKQWLLEELGCVQESGLIERIYGHTANFIFFRAKKGLAKKILAHRILIRDCSNYQGLTDGYYRIAVRTHEENQQLIKALKAEVLMMEISMTEGGVDDGEGYHDTGNNVECR